MLPQIVILLDAVAEAERTWRERPQNPSLFALLDSFHVVGDLVVVAQLDFAVRIIGADDHLCRELE